MPEWSNGAVSKTVVLLAGTGGSNPPLSAMHGKIHSESCGFSLKTDPSETCFCKDPAEMKTGMHGVHSAFFHALQVLP